MHRLTMAISATIAINLALSTACEQRRFIPMGDVQSPYREGRPSVVGTAADGVSIRGSTPPLGPNDCILMGDNCLHPDRSGTFCERDGGPYDVVLADGDVVLVVCYPPDANGNHSVVVNDNGTIMVPQNENNTTITFDMGTDGIPIDADMVIEGNNVAVYGNGVEETVLHGDVVLAGNTVRLRGLTIDGNLTLPNNDVAAVFVRVTGTVRMSGNNGVLAGSDVFGELTVTSNSVVLVQNRIQGAVDVDGNDGVCIDNGAFVDGNADGIIDVSDIGGDISCGD